MCRVAYQHIHQTLMCGKRYDFEHIKIILITVVMRNVIEDWKSKAICSCFSHEFGRRILLRLRVFLRSSMKRVSKHLHNYLCTF